MNRLFAHGFAVIAFKPLPIQRCTNIPVVTTTARQFKQDTSTTENAPKQRKPKEIRITLIDKNQSIQVTTFVDAQKLAKRRELHLVQLQALDAKTNRPVYKLATAAELLTSEMAELTSDEKPIDIAKDKNVQIRSEKNLTIGSRMSEHDLQSRLKQIGKWLHKQHEVRILIQGAGASDLTASETIFKTIAAYVKDPAVGGNITQKQAKGGIIKFRISPLRDNTTTTGDTITA